MFAGQRRGVVFYNIWGDNEEFIYAKEIKTNKTLKIKKPMFQMPFSIRSGDTLTVTDGHGLFGNYCKIVK